MRYLDKAQLVSNLETRMQSNMDAAIIENASVWVWQDGEEIYRRRFGPDASEASVYRLASMTKPITAIAILKQIERGLVSLDDPLDKFIPEYAEMEIGALDDDKNIVTVGKAKTKITVKHLLSHSRNFVVLMHTFHQK